MSESKDDPTSSSKDEGATPAAPQQLPPSFPGEEMARPAIEAARDAARLQSTADLLRQQASRITDPAERERLWRAAYDKEVEAHGQSKKARAMASGWGQGAGAGAALSGAVGMGLGNLVGVLLSGVVAVPGVLVGSGVGALHGPWYKITGGKKGAGKEGDGGGEKGGKDEGESGGGGSGSDAKGKDEEGDFSDEEEHRAIVEAVRKAEGGEKGS
ncbi:uncharacterized protein E0L32_001105 [Thyridium curvatum]|uniref:Uncharacterized protein n=1 Tax=Thyridium curvatum TaxID=1093900 RepID=A0A507AUW9_9PEZI|nr:uncharacterized protein E0L32_001105 [Thyridium curvatum]TPX11287.1 hypothetical protein E0L32_001105 [Thyridium curvatum]